MQREKIDYPFIDGLRLLAFLLVFFRHFNFFTVPVLHEYGWIGVEFFFLISGFLITRLLVTEFNTTGVIDKRKFFMRRILRIWPLYFFYLFLVLFLSIIYPGYPVSVPRLAGNLLFADNWISALKNYNPNFASFHLWSISLEEQFYFVLPFCGLAAKTFPQTGLPPFYTYFDSIYLLEMFSRLEWMAAPLYLYITCIRRLLSGGCYYWIRVL